MSRKRSRQKKRSATQKIEFLWKSPEFMGGWLSVWCVCGQLQGVTLERNKEDYYTGGDGKIVVDGVEWKKNS